MAVTREPEWLWSLPTEDEWYKAAYHQNNGPTGDYWEYPTRTDNPPSNDLVTPDPGNNATFVDAGWTIGPPYYRTETAAHENSASPYGTYDQGGNLWEWNEAVLPGHPWAVRGGRGGGFLSASYLLYLSPLHRRMASGPAPATDDFGFRVARIPEPTTLSLLALAGLALLRRCRLPG